MTLRLTGAHALLFYGVCAGALIPVQPALAQSAGSPGTVAPAETSREPMLDEIIVTAQRVETSLQSTPISVTAVSGETLQQRGSNSLLDLAPFTPSLSIASNNGGSGQGASIALRGMGVGAPDSSAAVGVYVDEVYQPSIFGNLLGLLDVERVEVLRGPQGTLFGRNTIGGAIQYISEKPGHEQHGWVEATLGSVDRRAIRGALNLPLGETLAVRIAAADDVQGGYVTDDLNGIDRGEVHYTLGRVHLLWTPTEKLSVDLKAEYGRRADNGRPVAIIGVNPNAQFAGLAFLNGETRPLTNAYLSTQRYHFAGYNTPDYFESETRTYSGVVNYDLTDSITFKSISAYVDNESSGASDFDMTPLNIFAANRGVYEDKVFTQELQLNGASLSKRLDWTLGAYYFSGDLALSGQGGIFGVPGFPTPFGPNAPTLVDAAETEVRSIAGYGQATFHLTENFAITGGLRYTHEDVKGSDVTLNLSNEQTYTDWSPSIGANWQAGEDFFLYAKASKGFRAGGFTINNALLGSIDPRYRTIALPFDQETAWTYEVGARMEFLDHRLRINPTIFYTDWKNIQFQRDVATAAFIVGATQNAGDAKIRGAELETQFAATDNLLLTASGSLLDSEYTRIESFVLNTYPLGFLAFLGGALGSFAPVQNLSLNSPLQQSPDYKYALGARYTQPLSNDAKVIGSLDWGYTDAYRIGVTDGSSQTIKGYGVLNGRLQYVSPDDRVTISVYGNNLLDEYYLIGGDGKGKGYTIGTDQGDVARPREVGVTMAVRF